ncbi:pilus assembly protein PilM [Planctomycetota bacterium]|nr:pilus assembly protein PilM [Planctomycetota bacterium]
MLQLSHGIGCTHLGSAVERLIDGNGIADGKSSYTEALSVALNEGLYAGGFVGNHVSIGVCGERVMHKHLRLPRMPADEIKGAVKWEAAQRFGFNEDTYSLQFYNVGEVMQGDEERLEIALFAMKHRYVEEYIQALDMSGLKAMNLEVSCASLNRWSKVVMQRKADEVQVVIDLGKDRSQVLIHRDGRVLFYKLIDICGYDFDKTLSRQMGVGLDEAKALRLKYGQDDVRDDLAMKVRSSLRQEGGILAREIGLCLRYYGVTFRGSRPHCAVLVGDESRQQWLHELIEEQTGLLLQNEWSLDWLSPNEALGKLRDVQVGDVWSGSCGLALFGREQLKWKRGAA